MTNIQSVGSNSIKNQVPNNNSGNVTRISFKNDNNDKFVRNNQPVKTRPAILNQQDMMIRRAEAQQKDYKKQKIKQNLITSVSIAASVIMLAYFGRHLLKEIRAEQLMKKGMQDGPTEAQRELGIKTKQELAEMFTDVSNAKSFSDLKMSKELRETLENILDKIRNAKTYEEFLQEMNNAILLYGPPGTGKTTFVKALCKELNVTPFIYDMGVLKGGYQGTTETNMKNASKFFLDVHRKARKENPEHISFIFFDECDEVFQKATGPNKDSNSQILTRFKRCFDEWKQEKGVFIFGNTNKTPGELDDAIANRMKAEYIPCPNAESLSENFFNHYKNGTSNRIAEDLKNPSKRSDKFFNILARDGREFSYRNLEDIGWKDGVIANKDVPLSLNDIIQRAISAQKELRFTPSEIRELESLII